MLRKVSLRFRWQGKETRTVVDEENTFLFTLLSKYFFLNCKIIDKINGDRDRTLCADISQ